MVPGDIGCERRLIGFVQVLDGVLVDSDSAAGHNRCPKPMRYETVGCERREDKAVVPRRPTNPHQLVWSLCSVDVRGHDELERSRR